MEHNQEVIQKTLVTSMQNNTNSITELRITVEKLSEDHQMLKQELSDMVKTFKTASQVLVFIKWLAGFIGVIAAAYVAVMQSIPYIFPKGTS